MMLSLNILHSAQVNANERVYSYRFYCKRSLSFVMDCVRIVFVAYVGPDGCRIQHTGCVERCGTCSVERSLMPALGGDLEVDCRSTLGPGVWLGRSFPRHQKGQHYAVVKSQSSTSWRVWNTRQCVNLVIRFFPGALSTVDAVACLMIRVSWESI